MGCEPCAGCCTGFNRAGRWNTEPALLKIFAICSEPAEFRGFRGKNGVSNMAQVSVSALAKSPASRLLALRRIWVTIIFMKSRYQS